MFLLKSNDGKRLNNNFDTYLQVGDERRKQLQYHLTGSTACGCKGTKKGYEQNEILI